MKWSRYAAIAIGNGLLLLLLTWSAWSELLAFDPVLPYFWHKFLHITGVVIFMGNMIAGPVWFLYAYYTREIPLMRFAFRLLQLTDVWLTIPGLALTVINGLFLARAYGGLQSQPWLYYSLLSMLVMWVLSWPVIWIQEKMSTLFRQEPPDLVLLNRWLIRWGIAGTLVSLPAFAILYWMIFKPS